MANPDGRMIAEDAAFEHFAIGLVRMGGGKPAHPRPQIGFWRDIIGERIAVPRTPGAPD